MLTSLSILKLFFFSHGMLMIRGVGKLRPGHSRAGGDPRDGLQGRIFGIQNILKCHQLANPKFPLTNIITNSIA